MPLLSVIIPVYNEEKTIELILTKLTTLFNEKLNTQKENYELVIVNDCSIDRSDSIISSFIEKNSDVSSIKYIQHKKNQGKGAAIRSAVEHIRGKYTIIQDADLEYDPADILKMLSYIQKKDLKVLYGSRFLKKDNRHSYKAFYLGGRLVSLITNNVYNQKLTDEPTCYKMFDSTLLKSIKLRCTRFEFCPEVTAKTAKLGYKIEEIPISYYPRSMKEGKKISWKDGVEAIWVLLKYRFYN